MKATQMTASTQGIENYVSYIDEHLKSFKAVPTAKATKAKANIGSILCVGYAKAKPIIDLLGMILGKGAGATIGAISSGISAYCEIDNVASPSDVDMKKKSKAIAAIAKAYNKFKPLIDSAILIFATRPEWSKVLKALKTSIEQIIADPVTF